jgi:hypothetical protein
MPKPAKPKPKPKLTDAERHQRFKDMAREVEASEDPSAFEKAFGRVTAPERKKD